jgi:hypothetical protein
MYLKVDYQEIINQEWLDQAFAPLNNYLSQFHRLQHDRIISNIMFMCNEGGEFQYKNRITRSYIIFNQLGELVYCADDSLHL